MNILKNLVKKIQGLVRRMPSVLYGWSCVILLFIALTIMSFMPYAFNSIRYMTYDCKQEKGVIQDTKEEEKEYAVHRGKRTEFTNKYFQIDGQWILVNNKDYLKYQTGDLYVYYCYEKDGNTIGSSIPYRAGMVVLLLLGEALSVSLLIIFLSTDTKKQEEKEKQETEKRIDFKKYSTNELYEMAKTEGCRPIEGKKNNRQYLENLLRKSLDGKRYRKEIDGNTPGYRIFFVVFCGLVIWGVAHLIWNYSQIIGQFIYLFWG